MDFGRVEGVAEDRTCAAPIVSAYRHLIDTHTSGARCDVTPLFAHPAAFAALIDDLACPFTACAIDYVAGIDALGFVLGAPLALRLGAGFVPIRKGGKLPVAVMTAACVDYSGYEKTLELREGIIPPFARVLVVDEWIETGAQVQAALTLVERAGAMVVGIAAINIDAHPHLAQWRERYVCHAVWFDMQPHEE